MAILVTGGGGYIGSHMVHALADAGEAVVVIDDLSTGFRSALPSSVPLLVGDVGNETFVGEIIETHGVTEIIHFAASIVVPDSVRDPLGYYRNNTMNARALLATAVKSAVRRFIFSSTAAVYGNPERVPVAETDAVVPMSPYGSSKRMTEIMLEDVGAAHGLEYVILRYFNVAGADPQLRTGQSTRGATHLIKVAVETALGLRPRIEVYGTDYDYPRRNMHPGLYPRRRSRPRAFRRARASAPGRRQRNFQLRVWTRLFGAGSDRGGQTRERS